MGKYKEVPRYNVISMRVSDAERVELQNMRIPAHADHDSGVKATDVPI